MTWSMSANVPINADASATFIDAFEAWQNAHLDEYGDGTSYHANQVGIAASSVAGMVNYVLNPRIPETLVLSIAGNSDEVGAAELPIFVDINAFLTVGGNLPLLSPNTIDRTLTGVPVVNSAAEATLYTYSVPANRVGATQQLLWTGIVDYLPNDGSNVAYTYKVKFGGSTVYQDTVTIAKGTNRQTGVIAVRIANLGATNLQEMIGAAVFGNNATTAPTTGIGRIGQTAPLGGPFGSGSTPLAVDMTAAALFEVSVTIGVASATVDCNLRASTLEVVG